MIRIQPRIDATSDFHGWADHIRGAGRLPRIVVLGSVGKSTVARLVDEVARAAGLRTALRTDGAVEIGGHRLSRGPGAWRHALLRLASGSLDVAVEEVSWPDVSTLSEAADEPGMVVASTICPDRDACRLESTRSAITSLKTLLAALPADVPIVVDLDDAAFPLLGELDGRSLAVSAIRPNQPVFRRRYADGALGAWVDDGAIVAGRDGVERRLGPASDFPLTLDGSARFQARNIMAASLACLEMGLPAELVSRTLRSFEPSPTLLPRSLGLIRTATTRVLVDRPSPSWFLAPLLKTLRALGPRRLTCVADYPSDHPVDDLVEVGRMLARQVHAFVLIDEDVGLAGVMGIRSGIAQTPHPPPIIHATSLARAVRRAVSIGDDDDLTLVLSHRPHLVHRVLAADGARDVA